MALVSPPGEPMLSGFLEIVLISYCFWVAAIRGNLQRLGRPGRYEGGVTPPGDAARSESMKQAPSRLASEG